MTPNKIHTVAVTGASGFCGSHAANLLAHHGYAVVTLGRRPGAVGSHRYWDASTGSMPDLEGVDAVVHLAASVGDFSSRSSRSYQKRVNVGGAERLLASAGTRRIVWVSSSSVYDATRDSSLVREDHSIRDGHQNDYGRTKAIGDGMAQSAGAVVLRPRAVYGPGDTLLLPRLLAMVRGGVLALPGPDVQISLTHVGNLAAACLAALNWRPGPYNIADATPYRRNSALLDVLQAATGIRPRLVEVPAAPLGLLGAGLSAAGAFFGRDVALTRYAVNQLARPFVLDLERALSTGWKPRFSLADFLQDLRGAETFSAETRMIEDQQS